MSRTSSLLQTTSEQKVKTESLLEQKQRDAMKLESVVKSLSSEVMKGNDIIQRLQNELKSYKDKVGHDRQRMFYDILFFECNVCLVTGQVEECCDHKARDAD